MRARFLIAVLAAFFGFSTARQAGAQSDSSSGDSLRIFLMTFSPGSIIYERFGHNVLVVHDPNPSAERIQRRLALDAKYGPFQPVRPFSRTDRAHHYGAFDFGEGFVPRFVMGRMVYWTTSDWADLTALTYAQHDRAILLQELNLTPAQKVALRDFLETN